MLEMWRRAGGEIMIEFVAFALRGLRYGGGPDVCLRHALFECEFRFTLPTKHCARS